MASAPVLSAHESERLRRRRREILADVRETLTRTPRELSAKYFYDERGSELFEQITRLPEYYLTRAEREILVARAPEIVAAVGPCTLVELGAGSAVKTRILLDAMLAETDAVTYVPVDVSEEFLTETARALESEYESLRIVRVVADIGASFRLPSTIEGPVLFAFLGSTIGNFPEREAVALLTRIRAIMSPRDRLLLGTDLHKDATILHRAYNDTRGVTAEFNRNMLRVLNAELGADFAPDRFAHRASYNERERRIEMYLDAVGDQTIHVPGMPSLHLADGETIRTELSQKYDHASVSSMLRAAAMVIDQWYVDTENQFALSVAEPAG